MGSLLQLTTAVTFSPIENYSQRKRVSQQYCRRYTDASARVPDKSFQVSVEAATVNLHTGAKQVTNIFHYTFSSKEPLQRFILPETYCKTCSRQSLVRSFTDSIKSTVDGLSWLESMRRREVGRELRQLYAS